MFIIRWPPPFFPSQSHPASPEAALLYILLYLLTISSSNDGHNQYFSAGQLGKQCLLPRHDTGPHGPRLELSHQKYISALSEDEISR